MTHKYFVLSGGGARGFAHVGVAQALRDAGIRPKAIAGTSAGSIIGAFLADGFEPEEVREIFVKQLSLTSVLRWNSLRQGLLSLDEMGKFMQKNMRHDSFEQLPIPLYVTATNFVAGRQHIFDRGPIIPAVLAACSIPAIFPPRMIDDIPYVDGGLSNNLPVEPFSQHKRDVIAVYVNPFSPFSPKSSIATLIDRAWHLSFREVIMRSAEGCHLFIEPPQLASIGLFDAHKLPEIYEHGYQYTRTLLQEKKG